MINYSICGRQNPQSQDLDIKYYANAQHVNNLDMAAFAKHIQSHGSVYSRADIMAVLTLAVDCIREQLLEGNKVSLGELGSFSVAFHSEGTRKAEDFTAANITAVNVNWTPGPLFKDLRKEAVFRKVPTRNAQALVLAAETKGDKTGQPPLLPFTSCPHSTPLTHTRGGQGVGALGELRSAPVITNHKP